MKYFMSLLCLFTFGGAVIQEITFHESFENRVGNSFTFREHVANTSRYSLEKVVRFCQTSAWPIHESANFTGSTSIYFDPGCVNRNGTGLKSFRYLGNRDTSVDGVSLYTQALFRETEIYVGHSPYGGIDTPIKSIAFTGKSNWTVFEGKNFEGRTACLTGGTGDEEVTHSNLNALNITTVGSLFKGQCLTSVSAEMQVKLRQAFLHTEQNN